MKDLLHLPPHLHGNVWCYGENPVTNRRHRHAELELNLVTRGQGTYLLGNRRYQIRRGDLLWLFPAQDHVLFEQTADFQMWIGVFKRKLIKHAATDPTAQVLLGPQLVGEACKRLNHRDLQRLEALFVQLLTGVDPPGLFNAGLGYALLQAWRCFQNANVVPVRDVHPAVERAAHLIHDATDLSLDQLSYRAGLSSARLSRLFKQQTGFAMVEFRNRRRMERFLEIYGAGQRHTMLDAALEAGFGSYPQFHRVFKRSMGISPGQYRHGTSVS